MPAPWLDEPMAGARVVVAGSINMDVVARVARLPLPGETVRGSDLTFHPGGKGANQAIAAARAEAVVAMLGCLGSDPYADRLEAFLVANGIDLAGVRRTPDAATGVALILVDASGENTIVSIPGANALLAPGSVGGAAGSGDVLLAQFETPTATTTAFFSAGREVGAVTVLNAAPAADPAGLLGLTDVLVVNEIELAACAGEPSLGSATPDVVAAARRLQARGPGVVVVTLGSRGVVAVDGPDIHELAAHAVVAVDATGAGDCFTGSLAARLAAAAPISEALAYANAAASLSVERPGAGPSMPAAGEVWARLRSPKASGSPPAPTR